MMLIPAAISAAGALSEMGQAPPDTNPNHYAGFDYTGLENSMRQNLALQAGNAYQQGAMGLQAMGLRGADTAANQRGVESNLASAEGGLANQMAQAHYQSQVNQMQNTLGWKQNYNQQQAQALGQAGQGIGSGIGMYYGMGGTLGSGGGNAGGGVTSPYASAGLSNALGMNSGTLSPNYQFMQPPNYQFMSGGY